MSEFKNLPLQYLQSCPSKSAGQSPEIFPISPSSPFTIGRSHENSLQILDNTISKRHAKISLLNGTYFLQDLSSANGVFVNGDKIQGNTKLEHEDSIQFGKYSCLYMFVNRNAKPKSKANSKINLKDYLFQDNPQPAHKNNPIDAMESAVTQPISRTRSNAPAIELGRKKIKPKQSKIRIPDLSDYLKLAQGTEGPYENPTVINSHDAVHQKYTRPSKKDTSVVKQGKIKLQSLQQEDPTDEDLKQFKLEKRQRNIFLQEQEALQNIQRQKRIVEEEKLKKELEQAKISEDLLQKQLILEQKVREEQEKVEAEKQRLEREFLKREQMKREEQLARIKKMQEKQKQMLEQMEELRNRQLLQLKKKEQTMKLESENQFKQEYEKRKKELEMEAEALARQYENIYRETIKKVRTQIDTQEQTVQKLQQKEEQLKAQFQKTVVEVESLKQQLSQTKNLFIKISGRNKACILFASDIQDKIDAIGTKDFRQQQNGYFQPSQTTKSAGTRKIVDSIVNSRKLLRIKSKEHEKAVEEMNALSASIKQKQYGSTSDVSDFLETMGENLLIIQNLKKQYIEMIECQRAIEEAWEGELQENNELQSKNRVLQSQIAKNIKQIDENSKDYIKKSTEQRLHMLKLMHFCPEQKKKAAKFLIEEMLNIQQEIHKLHNTNEDIHKKIGKVISQTEKIKRENQYLSEILFSQDENGHHFDNMKIVINNLIDKISQENNVDNIADCVGLSEEALKFQLLIQHQLERKKRLKEKIRAISEMGLAPAQTKIKEKNPLVFFGDALTFKQIEIEKTKHQINNLESEIGNIKGEIKIQEQKKQKISEALQKYKAEQLSQAKKYLSNIK